MKRDSDTSIMLDKENPWPALSPFDESGAYFFHGRDEEVAVLQRAVLQAPLTVLFGQSGLGKTSLLKAGLFPQLRKENFLPVYVRINVQDREMPLVDQLRAALQNEILDQDVDAPAIYENETLWEYLHRSKLELWSAQNQLLLPLFVIDQFEEVFTLGSGNSKAVAKLRVDLADLIENRIPATIVARSEATADSGADFLEYQRQAYKLIVSFREDFLPSFEAWKREMPSLQKNRVRLLPMTGEQAFKAIHDSAPEIAGEEISVEVVKFVAAAQSSSINLSEVMFSTNFSTEVSNATQSELSEIVVEPALLSLLCHGLNERRKEKRLASFDRSLLSGAGSAIIEEFYQRCLEDLPDSLQRFIENELITENGFRKPCAEDDARQEYGLTEDVLQKLVDRRLLRIEPYHGTTLIELIHDVLAPVVRQRRTLQQELQRKVKRQAELEAFESSERQKRKFRMLICLIGLVGSFAYYALSLKQEETKQRNLAEKRLDQLNQASLIRKAALSEDQKDLYKLVDTSLSSLLKNKSIKFKATAEDLHYKDSKGRDTHKFSVFPAKESLPTGGNSIAIITYITNHPSFKNSLLTTGSDRKFTATYIGWGCLPRMVALIEYTDPAKPPTIAELDMCSLIGSEIP